MIATGVTCIADMYAHTGTIAEEVMKSGISANLCCGGVYFGAPEDFSITVKNVRVSAGAGFVVALTGDIMTMPGLPKVPAAEKIDIDENGEISGLF